MCYSLYTNSSIRAFEHLNVRALDVFVRHKRRTAFDDLKNAQTHSSKRIDRLRLFVCVWIRLYRLELKREWSHTKNMACVSKNRSRANTHSIEFDSHMIAIRNAIVGEARIIIRRTTDRPFTGPVIRLHNNYNVNIFKMMVKRRD